MTEMLLENNFMNINSDNAVIQNTAQTGSSKTNDFTDIFDSKMSAKTKSSTLGDVKQGTDKGNKPDKMSNFKKALKQAAGEISVENSLDLTLTRGVSGIISQLKDAAMSSINTEENIDEATENSNFDYISSVLNETVDDENKEEEEVSNSIQILAMSNSIIHKDFEYSDIENSNLQEFNKSTVTLTTKDSAKEEFVEELKDADDSIIDENMMKELNIESVESKTASYSDEFTDKQSPEEHGMKVMLNNSGENFDINSVKQNEVSNTETKTSEINPSKIIEQITKQIETSNGNSKVNIVLNPEALGRVDLQIINTKEGLSAQFTVTTNEARELLMKGLDGLKEALLAQGVGVDNISVKISETEESSYNQDWTNQDGSRGGNKEGGEPRKDEKEKGLFEKTIAQNLEETNGSV